MFNYASSRSGGRIRVSPKPGELSLVRRMPDGSYVLFLEDYKLVEEKDGKVFLHLYSNSENVDVDDLVAVREPLEDDKTSKHEYFFSSFAVPLYHPVVASPQVSCEEESAATTQESSDVVQDA